MHDIQSTYTNLTRKLVVFNISAKSNLLKYNSLGIMHDGCDK